MNRWEKYTKAINEAKRPAPTVCTGLRYRADISTRNTKRGIMRTVHLRMLKSRSCPGCATCVKLLQAVESGQVINGWNIVEHGRVYRLASNRRK